MATSQRELCCPVLQVMIVLVQTLHRHVCWGSKAALLNSSTLARSDKDQSMLYAVLWTACHGFTSPKLLQGLCHGTCWS